MIKKDDILNIKIDKLVSEGVGLGKIDDFVIFVKNACPEDFLKIKILKVNKNFARAVIVEIVEPSKYRIKPVCPIFNACGACHLQFIDYDFLAHCKQKIVEEALNFKTNEIVKSPKTKEYRCKIQYPCRETKSSKRVLVGYFKEKTHDITNIKFCPMSPSITDEITEFIRLNWKFTCFKEENGKGLLKHILIRLSKDLSQILVIFVLNAKDFSQNDDFFAQMMAKFPQIKGILLNFNPNNSNTILSDKNKLVFGKDFYIETIGEKSYKIGALSFFQVNPYVTELLFDEIKNYIKKVSEKENRPLNILDCYGGVGAIGCYISDFASSVTLVEQNEQACIFARENFILNSFKNFEILKGAAEKVLKENKKFDVAIIDPPRKGCEASVLEVLAKCTNKIVYVSCNPSTLRRDIDILQKLDFSVKFARPFDMFPYTSHIETLCILEKNEGSL